jgi:hypothetical protein
MTTWKIFAYVFALIALIFEGFFGIIPFIWFVLQIIVIACALYLLVSIFRRKNAPVWKTAILQYTVIILATIGFFTTTFLLFIEYQYHVPGIVSDVTFSNSGQEIVFVEMSHIATPEFYSTKKSTIATLAQSGYTILMEGVKPGTPENQTIFNQSMGFDFTPTLYARIADLIWLQSQDNKDLFAGIATGSLVSIDLSIDDIVRLMGTGTTTTTGSLRNIESEIQSTIDTLSGRERIFIGWIARGVLSWSLKQSDSIDVLLTSPAQSKLFETIIDRRNDRIVEYIVAHPKEKIAVVYWALHFNGVYHALQKINPKWQITQIQTSAPYGR